MIWEKRYNDKIGEEFRACLLSARNGNPEAAYCLGWMFFVGKGVESDRWEAASIWHDIAARYEFGHFDYEDAMFDAAIGAAAFAYFNCSYLGLGIGKDEDHAVTICENAAYQGILKCQFQLSLIYEEGYIHPEGDASPVEEAYFWMMVSSIMGNKTPRERIVKIQNELDDDQIFNLHQRIFSYISENGNQWKLINNLFETIMKKYPINFEYLSGKNFINEQNNIDVATEQNNNDIEFDDIETLRRLCSLTVAEFCQIIGISRAAYYSWMQGRDIRISNKTRLLRIFSQLQDLTLSDIWHDISRSLHSKGLDSKQKIELLKCGLEKIAT